jgi:hypothetical protein
MVKQDYLSYLLRLWWAGKGERDGWRASLQDASTGERKSFASLDDLLLYLRQRMASAHLPEATVENDGSMPGHGERD